VNATPSATDQQVPVAARPATTPPPWPPTWAVKVTMAVTGTVFVAFVVVHLFGNLKVYLGPEAFDHYAEWLKSDLLYPLLPHGVFIWVFRSVLALCLVLHVAGALLIAHRGGKARGRHPRKGQRAKKLPTHTMLVTGLVLLFFIVFHILDLTIGARPAASEHFEDGSAYANLVYSFQRPAVAIFYMLAVGLLTVHVLRGVVTLANDFGATGQRLRQVFTWVAGLIAAYLLIGNLSIPVAVLAGWVS
jgi:succinate dehydrogenase / fumarate reductase cytochrome b subunit